MLTFQDSRLPNLKSGRREAITTVEMFRRMAFPVSRSSVVGQWRGFAAAARHISKPRASATRTETSGFLVRSSWPLTCCCTSSTNLGETFAHEVQRRISGQAASGLLAAARRNGTARSMVCSLATIRNCARDHHTSTSPMIARSKPFCEMSSSLARAAFTRA